MTPGKVWNVMLNNGSCSPHFRVRLKQFHVLFFGELLLVESTVETLKK